ncbi:MAG: hypothetical protein ACREBW_06025 [Candidatus Micrarchaeaceae archaeon]
MFANSKLIEIKNLPQSSVGAPLPSLLSSERNLFLLYYLQNTPENWDGKTVRMVDVGTTESVGIINFAPYSAYKFGPPSDETIRGHPLYKSGLKPYSFFEVEKSEWIETLEKMNSVHPHHKKERFQTLKHYIFTFHDSTFECVARSYELEIKDGPMSEVYKAYAHRLISE